MYCKAVWLAYSDILENRNIKPIIIIIIDKSFDLTNAGWINLKKNAVIV
jgi:plasmid maintenance system antidote protein VapI